MLGGHQQAACQEEAQQATVDALTTLSDVTSHSKPFVLPHRKPQHTSKQSRVVAQWRAVGYGGKQPSKHAQKDHENWIAMRITHQTLAVFKKHGGLCHAHSQFENRLRRKAFPQKPLMRCFTGRNHSAVDEHSNPAILRETSRETSY